MTNDKRTHRRATDTPHKPGRLTRQARAKVRQFLRDQLARNPHRRTDKDNLNAMADKNRKALATDGKNATVFYAQDQGAGMITVSQIVSNAKTAE